MDVLTISRKSSGPIFVADLNLFDELDGRNVLEII